MSACLHAESAVEQNYTVADQKHEAKPQLAPLFLVFEYWLVSSDNTGLLKVLSVVVIISEVWSLKCFHIVTSFIWCKTLMS